MTSNTIYTIAEFEFDTVACLLRRSGESGGIVLTGTPARLLTFLIREFGNASLKPEYKDKLKIDVWNYPHVTEEALSKAATRLREYFGSRGEDLILKGPYRLGARPILKSGPRLSSSALNPTPSATDQEPSSSASAHGQARQGNAWETETAEQAPKASTEGRIPLNVGSKQQYPPGGQETVRKYNPLTNTLVGMIAGEDLFSYEGGYAEAIRLFGRGDQYVECVSPLRLHVSYERSVFTTPEELQNNADERIAHLNDEASRENKLFFNGPVVRLIHFHRNQEPPDEADNLRLTLGPAGWFDLEGTNNLIRESKRQRDAYNAYVDLAKIKAGDFGQGCRLSNVIGNAITVFTTDGMVGYLNRSYLQSAVPGWVTSAVAENVNRYHDDTLKGYPDVLLNPPESSPRSKDPAYDPQGVPHPLAAVRRGMAREVSRKILPFIRGIKVTGLAFGLDCLAPDLLWLVLVDVTEDAFLEMRRDDSGSEVDEGVIEFVPPSFDSSLTQDVLSRPDWVAAGKASLVRAIQLIKEKARPSGDRLQAFRALAR